MNAGRVYADEQRQMMRSRWLKYLDSVSGSASPQAGLAGQVFEELDRRYSEAHRHYHNWAHIAACLGQLDTARSLALHPAAVELALWFHDSVYIPGAPDNEQRSAEMLVNAAQRLNFSAPVAEEAQMLVLATRYLAADEAETDGSTRPKPRDRELIRDIDLSILGAPPAEFDRYEQAIRREYGFVTDGERRRRRIAVLEGFLALPSIYQTAQFRKRYERQARRNLGRSIARLRKLPAD
jgi:predicted metal-dependent HD superfamily phosphohydrolase